MRLLKTLIFTALIIPSLNATAEVFVIVNNDSSIEKMTIDEVRNIYQERKTVWENGSKIHPLALGNGDPAENEFCKIIYGKEATDVAIDWASRAAQNKSVNPPKQKRSQKSLIRTLKKDKNAIGFITDKDILKDKAKIILRIK